MSKKRFSFLNASEHFNVFQDNTDQVINWELCFICQEESSGQLVCPANSTSDDGFRGYSTVVDNLEKFNTIGKLPATLKRRIEKRDLVQELIKNKSKLHKSCRNAYDHYHYERACKRRKPNEFSEENALPYQSTRSNFVAQNFTPTCFFCDELEGDVRLCSAQTLGLDRKVRDAAR